MCTAQDALALLRRGMEGRATGSTRANAHSSRSHAVFMLRVEATWQDADGDSNRGGGATSRTSRMHLVDLAGERPALCPFWVSLPSPHSWAVVTLLCRQGAGGLAGPQSSMELATNHVLCFGQLPDATAICAGSERASASGAEGGQLREACAINSSLSALSSVIMKLTEAQRLRREGVVHIPYRDSRLTFLLRARTASSVSMHRLRTTRNFPVHSYGTHHLLSKQ